MNEDEIISKLGLIMLEIKSTYGASVDEKKQLKKLFKAYNDLLKSRYEAKKWK